MPSQSADASIVRSIRQRQLLNAWLRLFAKGGRMPGIERYEVDRLEEEKPDMIFYTVTYERGTPRYLVTFDGQRLIDAFGVTGTGRYLEDVIGPERAATTLPVYDECVARCRPSYSVRRVIDVEGREVDYERLLLPFGADGRVSEIIASLKTISADGGFQQRNLMRAEPAPPQHFICAIIDRADERHRTTPHAPADDVIEV
jgi:hypothetical protein